MNFLSIKLGYWSSVFSVIMNIVYGIGIVLVVLHPLPVWTNLDGFLSNAQPVGLLGYTLCQISSFILAPLCVVLFSCFHEYAPVDKKILTRIGFACIVATMILGNQMYFVHFSMVRLNITSGNLAGLEQLIEWNTHSALTASGALGWTFFIGLACLVVAPIFSGGKLERSIRNTFVIYGVFALLGTLGFLLDNMSISGISMLGALVSSTVFALLLSILYRRLGKTITGNTTPSKIDS